MGSLMSVQFMIKLQIDAIDSIERHDIIIKMLMPRAKSYKI